MTTLRLDRIGTYLVLGAFALIAIYPVLSILFLALHTKTDLVTGFAFPTRIDLSSFKAAWTEGHFATGFKSSFIVAGTVTAVSAVLSIGTGYAFGTMRFVGDRIVFPIILLGIIFPYEATVIPLYYDFQDVPLLHWNLLNTYWALILPQIGQSVAFGDVLDARLLPLGAALADRGGADRRRDELRRPLARARAAGDAGGADDVRARLHVHVERVPARARARLGQRVAPDGAARPQLLRGRRARRRPDEGRRRGGARRAADPASCTSSCNGISSVGCSRGDQGVRSAMARIKLVYLGGGSTRAAGTMASFMANGADFDGSEVVLVDLDGDRLELIRALAEKMARARGLDIAVTATTDRRAALDGCDAVLSSFRPGGFAARVHDERIPLEHGVIGQETQGAGGFFMALRAIAVLKDVCAEMEELCPDAWIFNYTNPVNIVAEAITHHSPVKIVSLCEGPIYFRDEIAESAGLDPELLSVTMVGSTTAAGASSTTTTGTTRCR